MSEMDRTKAEALRIAFERLTQLGWKYSDGDIGKTAAVILKAMGRELEAKDDR